MEHHFKEFKYQPGIITNIIFKSDYLMIKTEFLKNLDERKIRVAEVTEDCYNLIKANIFINDVTLFKDVDLCYIDTNTFGYAKTKLMLVLLEQVLSKKAIVVFSSEELSGVKLTQMKLERLVYPTLEQVKVSKSFRSNIRTLFKTTKSKINEVNQLLDEYDAYNQKLEEDKKRAKSKAATKKVKVEKVAPTKESLKAYKVNILFLVLFTLLSSLSGVFALSNTRDVLFTSTVESGVNQVNREGSGMIKFDVSSSDANYDTSKTRYHQEQAFSDDVIPFLTFTNVFRKISEAFDFHAVLFPEAGIADPNFAKLGYTLISQTSVTPVDPTHVPVIISESLVDTIFTLQEGETSLDYLGSTFSTTYSFQNITFSVANIVSGGVTNLESYYPNTLILFTKPSAVATTTVQLSGLIDNNIDLISRFMKAFHTNISIDYQLSFSFVTKDNLVKTDGFILNNIIDVLANPNQDYTIEIAFILIALLIAFFLSRIITQLSKVFGHDTKKSLIITLFGVGTVFTLFIGLFIFKLASNSSVLSLSLLNTFGVIYSLVLIVTMSGFVWYPKLKTLIEEKLTHEK